jgi:hypothetical protein
MTALETVAHEIAAAIMAGCAPGMPTHELMLKVFTDVYEIRGMPDESQHQVIARQVGARIQVRD